MADPSFSLAHAAVCETSDTEAIAGAACKCATDATTNECAVSKYCWTDNTCNDAAKPSESNDGGSGGGGQLSAEIEDAAEAKGMTCVTKTPFESKKEGHPVASATDMQQLYTQCRAEATAQKAKMFVIYPEDANERRSNCWLCPEEGVRASKMKKAFLFKMSKEPPGASSGLSVFYGLLLSTSYLVPLNSCPTTHGSHEPPIHVHQTTSTLRV